MALQVGRKVPSPIINIFFFSISVEFPSLSLLLLSLFLRKKLLVAFDFVFSYMGGSFYFHKFSTLFLNYGLYFSSSLQMGWSLVLSCSCSCFLKFQHLFLKLCFMFQTSSQIGWWYSGLHCYESWLRQISTCFKWVGYLV